MSDMSTTLRTPSHSIEAESAVIGALMLHADALYRIEFLRPDYFYLRSNRLIFEACRAVIDTTATADIFLVAESLKKNGALADCGGFEGLQKIQESISSAVNIRHYAERVRDCWLLRQLAQVSDENSDAAYGHSALGAREIVEAAQAKLMTLTEVHVAGHGAQTFRDAMPGFNEDMRRRQAGETAPIPTGFVDIDARAQIERGNLVILAGRPGTGKTAFASQAAEQAAARGLKSLLFSMEMSSRELISRSLARESGLQLSDILSGRAAGSPALLATQARLSALPIAIDDSAPRPIHEIRATARAMKRREGLDMIVLDYLQLMPGTGGYGKNRNEDLSDITRGLKALARELDIVVILLSQLSRKCEDRLDKRPMLSDLRDSGAIEQDADLVFLLYRHEYYFPKLFDWHGVAECNIAKFRNGPTGVIPLRFEGALTLFERYTGQWPLTAPNARPRRGFGVSDED